MSDTENTTAGLHSLKAIRLREEVSLRSIARRMGITQTLASDQEEGRCELSLSDLYRWQRALKVPISELLAVPDEKLTEEIRRRACLVRLAKSANSLVKKCSNPSERQLAQSFVHQLEELMPELSEVGSWPEPRPRPLADLGRAGEELNIFDLQLDSCLE